MRLRHAPRPACTIALFVLLACGSEPTSLRSTSTPTDSTSGRLIRQQCFFGKVGEVELPLSKIIHELRVTESLHLVDVAVVLNREFVDVTYGANAIGWEASKKGRHSFNDLVGSDHTELVLRSADGAETFRAKIDFLTQDGAMPTGYRSLGVEGGDGQILVGDASNVVESGSSLDDNFNRFGHVLTVDSPRTDSDYTPNPEFPDWNFFVEYRLTMNSRIFEPAGFSDAYMASVHASPSKFGTNTIEVYERECSGPGAEDDPFPKCVQLSEESGCVDPGSGGDGSPDPGSSGAGEDDGAAPPGPDI